MMATMLETAPPCAQATTETAPPSPAAAAAASQTVTLPRVDFEQLHVSVEQLQSELKFANTKIEALNFEIARLNRWRFGAASESLDGTTQAVLFDAILDDTEREDQAARDATKPPAAPRAKGKAVRQALPANLPRVDHHHEIEATHCACGQALERIGEEVSEQLDCVPAQFFVLRHIRGKYACACCQSIQAAPMPAQIIDKG
jgi:transposase